MKIRVFKGGTHVDPVKFQTEGSACVIAKAPQFVYIPLSQHTGAPCKVCVSVGDEVKMGQVIGQTTAFVSAPIHASVSGKVVGFEQKAIPAGRFEECIVIENDFLDTLDELIIREPEPEKLSADDLKQKVHDAGIVGLGGAAFPAHVKYTPPEDATIEYVVLNGIECEPYITADHRIMLEYADDVVKGLQYIMKMTGAREGVIAVEDNKMDAAAVLQKACEHLTDIQVAIPKEKYPQGSEKQLIYALTGREVPVGGLPLDVGVIVNNVGTAKAVCEAIEDNMPLIRRVTTVSGTAISNPANFIVRIGTLFRDLVEQAGGYSEEDFRLIGGGPMTGKALFTDDVPVIKGTSAVLALKNDARNRTERKCVRCAKCIDTCPVFIHPTRLATLAKRNDFSALEHEEHIMLCIECGSCSYVCPSSIPLLEWIRRGKQGVVTKETI